VIAFYLPQYHPVPENDEWWGKGFTEWTNVARGRPLYRGHRQPLLPGELGFYDLRVPEVREAQAQLAAEHGVEAFCYWHYWFSGRRLLERPFNEVLASGRPDLGFCLAWANQTWTGIWHGAADRVLIEQHYPGEADYRRHFSALLPAFRDPRYVRVDGKPLFFVRWPENLPDPRGFTSLWEELAVSEGFPGMYLVAGVSDTFGYGATYTSYREDGFSAGAYERVPARRTLRDLLGQKMSSRVGVPRGPRRVPHQEHLPRPPAGLPHPLLPIVFSNWDNTARSGRAGFVLTGSEPRIFARHVREAMDLLQGYPEQERILLVKSWNEWAEGNHLEPDDTYGRAYLEALRSEVGVRYCHDSGQGKALAEESRHSEVRS
jgi:hypothetical protein